jgi:CTP synthase (UTP-ammonia lyase)
MAASTYFKDVEYERTSFFVATLFQPELSALSGTKHPLAALVQTSTAGGRAFGGLI